MRHASSLILLGITCAPSVHAGAWMREEGSFFIATGAAVFEATSGEQQDEQTVYLEYGAGPNLTLGFAGTFNGSRGGDALAFLRLPVHNADRPAVLALEFGVGVETNDAITFDPTLKAGLSWGKGITMGERSGWVAVDGSVVWSESLSGTRLKLDTTFGLGLSERLSFMAQGFFEFTEAGETTTLMPSLILANASGKTRYVIGLEAKFGQSEQTGLRFGLWNEF